MKKDDHQLKHQILTFIYDQEDMFTLDEMVEAVRGDGDTNDLRLARKIEEKLSDNPWVFYHSDEDCYYPRHLFFNDHHFLISPTPMELERNYIIPGHRFIPFAPRFMMPSQFTVIGLDGSKFPWKKVELSFNDLKIYFTMFGYPQMMEYLMLEYEENAERLIDLGQDFDRTVAINVLDMGDMMDSFEEGGMLQLNVVDWFQGVYLLKAIPDHAKTLTPGAVETWATGMEDALYAVIEERGPMTDISEQFAWAYFLDDRFLIEDPPIHLGGFLSHLKELQFTSFNGFPMIWHLNESPEDTLFEHLWPLPLLEGVDTTLDDILQDVGSPITESEMEAYIRDSLFQGGKSVEPVLSRILKGKGEEIFAHKAQYQSFLELSQELWGEVKTGYNRFADKRIAGPRAECLVLLDNILNWMASVDRENMDPEDFHKKEFVAMAGLISMLSQTLLALNMDNAEIPTEGLEVLKVSLATMRDQSSQLINAVNAQMKPRKKPVFRVIQGGLSKK